MVTTYKDRRRHDSPPEGNPDGGCATSARGSKEVSVMLMPSIFGENLFDEFFGDWDREMRRISRSQSPKNSSNRFSPKILGINITLTSFDPLALVAHPLSVCSLSGPIVAGGVCRRRSLHVVTIVTVNSGRALFSFRPFPFVRYILYSFC